MAHASSRPRPDRRSLLRTGAALGSGVLFLPRLSARGTQANERLDLAVIGVGGRGRNNLDAVASENVVALCDVDAGNLADASKAYPRARGFADFRKLLDEVRVDAVVVSTPDHTHAAAAAAALARGLHVYCEKPLTRSVAEARHLARLAAAKGVATQMGTQIHAEPNYRRVVELVRSGAIGPIETVEVVCGKSWGGKGRPEGTPPVPKELDWELWLGPTSREPYHPQFHPAGWRRFWPFGNGTLGDMACHYMDLPFWALELSHAEHVEADGPPADAFAAPPSLAVTWRFPARGEAPPVTLTWMDGGRRPARWAELGLDDFPDGVLFVGTKGQLVADYTRYRLLPAERFRDFTPPAPTIPDSIGHHREWLEACKDGRPTTCAFAYSGPLSETVLLGAVAHRLGRGFDWNAAEMRAVDTPEAASLLDPSRAKGWELAG